MSAKQVHIRREKMHSHLPSEITSNSIRTIGSVLNGRKPLGIPDKDLQDNLMEQILGINKDDRNFRREVNDYLKNLRLKVPTSGVVLDVTMDEEGNPKNPEDFFKYEWIKGHPKVASTQEEMESSYNKEYYVHDPEKEVQRQNQKVQLKKKAYKELSKIDENPEIMTHLIRLLTDQKAERMSPEMMENVLSQQIEINPKRFLQYAEDRNLETRSLIEKLVEEGILRKSGNSYIYIDEVLGETIDDTIAFFNNERNSSLVLDLKEKLKQMAA